MISLYQMLNNVMPINMPMQPDQNLFQRMNEFAQAMRNPPAYILQKFPDIPEAMRNDPNQILAYLQRTRNITDQQIQQTYGNFMGQK